MEKSGNQWKYFTLSLQNENSKTMCDIKLNVYKQISIHVFDFFGEAGLARFFFKIKNCATIFNINLTPSCLNINIFKCKMYSTPLRNLLSVLGDQKE